MYLKNVVIKNFGAISEAALDLTPGVNILFGMNEAGKSTLLNALSAAFFMNADTRDSSIQRVRPWGTEADPYVKVIFEACGHEYELEKTFLTSKKATLRCAAIKLDSANKDKIAECLSGLLPLYTSNGSSLKNTFWIMQRQLEDTAASLSNDAEIRSALQRALFSADGDFEAIKAAVEKKIKELRKGLDRPTNAPGPVATARATLGQVSAELEALRSDFDSIEDDSQRFRGLTERTSALEKQIREEEAMLQAINDHHRTKATLDEKNKTLDSFNEQFDEVTACDQLISGSNVKINNIATDKKVIEEKISHLENSERRNRIEQQLATCRSIWETVSRLISEIQQVSSEKEKLPAIKQDDVNILAQYQVSLEKKEEAFKASRLALVARGISDTNLKVSEDGSDERNEPLKKGELKTFGANETIGLVIPNVITLEISSGAANARQVQREIQTLREQLDDLLHRLGTDTVESSKKAFERRTQLSARLMTLETERDARLNNLTMDDLKATIDDLAGQLAGISSANGTEIVAGESIHVLRKRQEELVHLHAQEQATVRTAETKVKKFLAEYGSLKEAEARRKILAREAYKASAAFEELPPVDVPQERIILMNKELVNHKNEHQQAHDEQLKLSGALSRNSVTFDAISLKEAAVEEAKRSFEEINRELKAYEILSQTLGETEGKVASSFMAPIEKDVAELLPPLTAGRYCGVSLNESLEVSAVKHDHLNISPNDLSTGAQGQLALALRLSLINSLSRDERQAVIIDDALVNFDEDRMERAKRLLDKFSESHQVIYLTCHSSMKQWPGACVRVLDSQP